MKLQKLRQYGIGIALLLSQNMYSQETFHVYLNNNTCESFIYDEVDSVTFCCKENSTDMQQNIWIRGKAYSFNVNDIERTDFVTPPTSPMLVVGRNPEVTKRNAILRVELVGADPQRTYDMGMYITDESGNRYIYYYPENQMIETVETTRDNIIGKTKYSDLIKIMKKGSRYMFNFDYSYFSNVDFHNPAFPKREYIYKFSAVDDQRKYIPGNFYAPNKEYTFRFLQDEITDAEYVDLGDGLLWQTKNLGAKSITDSGDNYAWAVLNPSNFTFMSEYPYIDWFTPNSYSVRQFPDISGSEDYDAARHALGDGWRIPTASEMNNLAQKCWMQYHVHNGVKGVLVTGTDGMTQMFIPHEKEGFDYSYFWTATPYDARFYNGWEKAYSYLSRTDYYHDMDSRIAEEYKFIGHHIRAVKTK